MYVADPDPTTPLGKLQMRARRVPVWLRVPLLFVAFALIVACVALDLPPYSLLVDLQGAAFDGQHYPVVSIGVTAIFFLVPVGIAIQLLAGLFPDNTPPDPFANLPPANAGPPPAYMQNSPYAQGLYGQGPQIQPPPGQAPMGQGPYGQPPCGQGPQGQPPRQG